MNRLVLVCVCLLVACNFLLIVNALEGDESRGECIPGKRRTQDCNICQCTNEKTWSCTEKVCASESRAIRDLPQLNEELNTTPCGPNDKLKFDCNTCYCKLDKSGYLCTSIDVCPPASPESTNSSITAENETTTVSNDAGSSGILSTTPIV